MTVRRLSESDVARAADLLLEASAAGRLIDGYQPREVARAIESVHASIEVVITCFSDWLNQRPLSLIAEGGPEQYLVLRPPVRDWQALDL